MKYTILILFLLVCTLSCRNGATLRKEINLNGLWEIARTDSLTVIPLEFNSKAAVPGLVDMAAPEIQQQDTIYENSVYWYRRTFTIDHRKHNVIRLKINKARYHTRVFINRELVGENIYNFTPSLFDIKPYLNRNNDPNEIIIAVGCKNNLPDTVTNGWDFEKIKYIPGIYDDVKIIMADFPFIENVQTIPMIKDQKLRVVAEINTGKVKLNKLDYTIRESVSGKRVAGGKAKYTSESEGSIERIDFSVPIKDCKLWSPESPFLYEIELHSKGDSRRTRFGMRSFEACADSGVFLLNDKPYYMRGTNVCIYRFFEDPQRGNLPWDDAWVTKLHSRFKEMHWTSIRYCIGFPPERWYEIADSLGFLIQDEYPLWTLGRENFEKYLGRLNPKQLAAEYREWMRERWNHPCVVVWDAQNESITEVTGKAVQLVRHLDISNRPWDNGWAPPVSRTDAIESHPYLFSMYMNKKPAAEGYLKELFNEVRIPGNDPNSHYPLPDEKRYKNPIILNEYGWIWLNRNGTTTTLTDKVYENVFPEADTPEKRLERYARTLGILTEYWRGNRKAAAVMHFCGLGYSRPDKPRGQTSDHFIDIRNLTFEPYFFKYVRSAFSPVGIMISFWENRFKPGETQLIPVNIINDTYKAFQDSVRVKIFEGESAIRELSVPVEVTPLGRRIIEIQLMMPEETGKFRMEASILYEGETITSLREFEIR